MTLTTIKVPSDLRDRLKVEAARHGRTLSGELEALLDDAARRHRFAQLADDMKASPPDAAYADEMREWQGDAWL